MLDCKTCFDHLGRLGIDFYAGVPDSLLKDLCAYIADHASPDRQFIAANEGAAIALAAGHHLATGKVGLVYMQNSGLGNTVNPLTSLADPEVYRIPMILLIGWRGEPGRPDEPQHVKQGRITLSSLDALEVPYEILPDAPEEAEAVLSRSVERARASSSPQAIVVRAGTFAPYKLRNEAPDLYEMTREDAVQGLAARLGAEDMVVATTGKTSRELFEFRAATDAGHASDFLTVGSMGHASQIALGIAVERPNRQILCFDGDGALIMHMGSLALSGQRGPENFKHVVLNNGAHDSVGGQPTVAHAIDIPAIARACGYREARRIERAEEIEEAMAWLLETPGPALLEVMTKPGARSDLGRPTTTPVDNKRAFMENLAK
ncbi:MAG: phosphonopyruvate decarboxylase [Myxococcota bacterium]